MAQEPLRGREELREAHSIPDQGRPAGTERSRVEFARSLSHLGDQRQRSRNARINEPNAGAR